jgi:hypothetical protein
VPGPAPDPNLMDSLALFTHGEFLDYDSDNPELLLFTHGEFGRPAVGAEVEEQPTGVGADGAVGTGRRRARRAPEIVTRRNEAEAIAMALLFADDDDDWF